MKKSAMIMLTVAAVFTGCSNDEVAPAMKGEGVEIALRSAKKWSCDVCI